MIISESGLKTAPRHARYWRKFLLPGENLIHAFGTSGRYIFIFYGMPLLGLLVLALFAATLNVLLGGMILMAAAGLLMPMLYLMYFVHYAITDQRVISREGVLYKKEIAIQLWSITDISVKEKFLERLLTRTGLIGINTAGSPGVELKYRHVKKPFRLRQDIYHHLKKSVQEEGRMQVG